MLCYSPAGSPYCRRRVDPSSLGLLFTRYALILRIIYRSQITSFRTKLYLVLVSTGQVKNSIHAGSNCVVRVDTYDRLLNVVASRSEMRMCGCRPKSHTVMVADKSCAFRWYFRSWEIGARRLIPTLVDYYSGAPSIPVYLFSKKT